MVATHKQLADSSFVALELLELLELPEGILLQSGPRVVGVWREVTVAKVIELGEDGGVGHVVCKLASSLRYWFAPETGEERLFVTCAGIL